MKRKTRGLSTYLDVSLEKARPHQAGPRLLAADVHQSPQRRALRQRLTSLPKQSRCTKVDVGWLVGLIVSGGTYLMLCSSFDLAREKSAIESSELLLRRL